MSNIVASYHTDIEQLRFYLVDKDADPTSIEIDRLQFQFGVVRDGRNGVTNEAVIEGLVQRLQSLNGKFPCRENSLAITKLEEALHWLNARTERRQRQGIEGKHIEYPEGV